MYILYYSIFGKLFCNLYILPVFVAPDFRVFPEEGLARIPEACASRKEDGNPDLRRVIGPAFSQFCGFAPKRGGSADGKDGFVPVPISLLCHGIYGAYAALGVAGNADVLRIDFAIERYSGTMARGQAARASGKSLYSYNDKSMDNCYNIGWKRNSPA